MNFKNITRRRGTTIAAAALSMALVAPAIQPVVNPAAVPAALAGTPADAGQPNALGTGVKYPGENADGVYQSVVDEPRYTFSDQPIKVDGAEESKGVKNDTQSIEGYVIHQRDGDISTWPGTNDPYRPIPMEGVRVYAQWTEKGGLTSPVYTTTTGADGFYSIKMKPFNNAKGEVVKFDADPNLPQREKIRVWVDNPDTDNFTQLYGYNFGNMGPNAITLDTPGGMGWGVGPDRVSNVRFAFGEKIRHDVMHRDDAVENPVDRQSLGSIKGRLFWHLFHTQGAFTPNLMNLPNGADVPATGMKVYGSYLSDYAVNEINTKAAQDLGFEEVRGSGWTNRDETALQNWIKRKMAEEGKDKWIAETAEATVDSRGLYQLQFKGTFGRGRTNGDVDRGYDDKALLYTDLARDNGAEVIFPDGTKHNAYNLYGQVAPSSDYGSWVKNVTGRGGKNLPKHVNWDWLFFSTEETEGLGQFTPFYNNSFLPRNQYVFDGPGNWAGGIVYGAGENYLLENRHIVYSDYTVFDVLEYDTRQNPAKPGDKVETKTSGLPIQWVDGREYQIEWVNQETGKVVKTCDAVAADPNGSIPSCQLDTGDKNLFPGGIESTTTFTAFLYPLNKETGERGQAIASDAFTVLVGWQPHYEETKADEVETPVKSEAPTFDNTQTKDVEKLTADELKAQDANKEVTKYEVAEGFELPEGYEVAVDSATGKVSVTFPKDAPSGASLDVPVKVTFQDKTTATANAPFVLDAKRAADQVEPQYEDKLVVPGEETKSSPTFKDKDGKDAKAPEGSKFTIPEDFKAPEGYEVKIDENTGEITVTFPDKSKLNKDTVEEFDVPVTVTYPDGSTDKPDAKFKLDTDGDGKPDSTDTDDDNDGADDEEEIRNDTNPKVPEQSNEFEPEYKPGSGTPGDDVKIDPPTFTDKDGNDTTAPDGTKFAPNEDEDKAPTYIDNDGNQKPLPAENVTVDPDTGEVTVKVPEDAKPEGKITVPVDVTYPDGSTDTVDVTVEVGEPTENPDWDDTSTTPDAPVTIPKTDGSGEVPEGSTVEVEGPGTAEINDDGSITVTPGENAKPGDKITVTVKDKDGKELDKIVVDIVDPWKDKETYPKVSVTVPKEDGFTVPEGSTLEVEGPGTAELLPNGDIKVTPNDDAVVDNKIKVTVKDKDGNKVDDFTVKIIEKPISSSEREGCTESLVGFGLPLLALIPLGIATQVAIPGLQDIQGQVGRQIQEANDALQRQLGIMDPNLAKAAADFQAQLRGAGANLGQVLGGLAVLVYGIAAITTIATKCGPGNTTPRTDVEVSSIFGNFSEGSSTTSSENGSSNQNEGNGSSSESGEQNEGSTSEGSSSEGSTSEGSDAQGSGSEAGTGTEPTGEAPTKGSA